MASRNDRQIKIDFSSPEMAQEFKEFCRKLGVSYSQMGELLIRLGMTLESSDLQPHLMESRVHWLRPHDIDIDSAVEDLGK